MSVQKVDVSIRQIAAGVFLGNLLFSILASIVLWVMAENAKTDALIDRANFEYNAMIERQTVDETKRAAP